MTFHLACPLTGHGLCSCTAGAPPAAAAPGYDAAAASLWSRFEGVEAGDRAASAAVPTTTVPVPPLVRRPGNLGALKATAAAAAGRAAAAEAAAQAAEAVARAAAARAAAVARRAKAPPPAAAAAPRPPPPPPPPTSTTAGPVPMLPAEADAATRAGARLQVKWTDGEWWDATVRPPPPARARAAPGCGRAAVLVYDTGEEEDGVDLAALAARGDVTWLPSMREWALKKGQPVVAPPRPPPPLPPPPPPPPPPVAAAARVPIASLIASGAAVRGTRLRVLLAGGAALEVVAGAATPGLSTGLPVYLPDGQSVDLRVDRDGVDFAVYVA